MVAWPSWSSAAWLIQRPAPLLASVVPGRLDERVRDRIIERFAGSSRRGVRTDLNVTLAAGSTVALAGENGSGKTTLVKLLLGRLVQGGERAGCYSSAAPTISDRDLYPLTRASGARKAHPKSVC